MGETGQKGEDFAAGALEEAGMEILCRNYKKRWGEIDIIAKDGEYLAFVEVKTRRAGSLVSPLSAVTLQKQGRVIATAAAFLQEHPLDLQPRFDVFEVVSQGGKTFSVESFQYIKGAFCANEHNRIY